jgi:hypothetical protein
MFYDSHDADIFNSTAPEHPQRRYRVSGDDRPFVAKN